MEHDSHDLALQKLLEQKKILDAKIRRKKAMYAEQERKARTKRLIEIGAVVEGVLGHPITKEDLPKLKGFLETQETRGKFFSSAMK